MDEQSLVQDLELELGYEKHRATYFIEGDLVHAMVDGKLYVAPINAEPAEAVIRGIIIEKALLDNYRPRHLG